MNTVTKCRRHQGAIISYVPEAAFFAGYSGTVVDISDLEAIVTEVKRGKPFHPLQQINEGNVAATLAMENADV